MAVLHPECSYCRHELPPPPPPGPRPFSIAYYFGLGRYARVAEGQNIDSYRGRVTHEHAWFGRGYRIGEEPMGTAPHVVGWYDAPVRGMLDSVNAATGSGLRLVVGANLQGDSPSPILVREYGIEPWLTLVDRVEMGDEPDWSLEDEERSDGQRRPGLRFWIEGNPDVGDEGIYDGMRWAGFRRITPNATLGCVYDRLRLSRLPDSHIRIQDWIAAEIYVDSALQHDWEAIRDDADMQFEAAYNKVVARNDRKLVLVPQAFTRSHKWGQSSYPNIVRLNKHLWDRTKPYAGTDITGWHPFNLHRPDGAVYIPGLVGFHEEVYSEARAMGLVP
jgi:hypothetical protein